MEPFIVEYIETTKRFLVLDRSGAWWTIANMESKEIGGTKSLKGYKFVGFPKRTGD